MSGYASYDGAAGVILPMITRELERTATLLAQEEYPYLAGALANTGRALNSTKLEWQDFTLRSRTVTTATGAQDTSADTAITCSEDVSGWIFPGMQLKVSSTQEILMVTGVSSTNLTVVRGYGGTPNTTIPSGTELKVVSQAGLEGQAYVNRGNHRSTQRYNYAQLFDEGWEITGTLEAIRYAVSLEGSDTQLGVEINTHMREMMQNMASTVLQGVAPASTTQGSDSVRRTMNGIREMIREGSAAGTGAVYTDISSSDFNSSDAYDNLVGHVKTMWDLGARPNLIVVNSDIAKQLATNQKNARQMYSESGASREFSSIRTNFGTLNLMVDAFMPNDSMLITNSGAASMHFLQPFTLYPLGKDGNSQRWQLVSEATLKVQDAATGRHGWFYNASV